ncbi:DUF7344 domain-containing protein [Halobellus clavatus]|jgi:hypothetical protein|uniref:DUF7344 domain-containing protein n=1 Tax=Halobellus clavatus TaxID=660517 RepID=A0A1H3H6E0_9EURY|nr:hypothetical protein [Halobellus clavatus]SDY10199.1 hypothetical protein SAMN04487946_106152 [Halobellus clavatus]
MSLRTSHPESILSETDIHDILRNDRRRRVIECLQDHRREVMLRDLAEEIAESETGQTPAPRNIRDSVYISLHQSHLPKLDSAGVVDYDSDRKTIRLCRFARKVDQYMEVVTKYGVSWASYYRSLGTMALFLVVLSLTGVPLVSAIDPLVFASLFLALIAGSTLYQLWTRRWLYLSHFE